MYRYLFASLCCLALLAPAASNAVVVADYQDDYNGVTFPTGWQYQWNAPSGWDGTSTPAGNGTTGGLFSLADYENLQAAGDGTWRVDGDTNSNNGSPGRFLRLTPTGGHPGRGSAQTEGGVNNTVDRYAIAAFTVSNKGFYLINDSTYTNNNPGASNGAEVIVHVDGVQTNQTIIPNNGTASFDHFVGALESGQTIYTAFGPNTTDGSDGFDADLSIVFLGNVSQVVADYQADFQTGGPAEGWRYQWNAPVGWDGTSAPDGSGNTGAIGDPSNYADLFAVGSSYRPDNDTTTSNGAPGNFLQLNPAGNGHPGRGSNQAEGAVGNTLDRYAITAFEVSEAGAYLLQDLMVDPISTAGAGGDVLVHVNGGPILLQQFFDNTAITIDSLFLGDLVAGDVIYVAVGPNVQDGSDSFTLNYQITRFIDVPEPTTAMLGLLGAAGLLRRRRRAA